MARIFCDWEGTLLIFIRIFRGLFFVFCAASFPAFALEVKLAILVVEAEKILPISRLDLAPKDLGLAGARVAIEDNQTTGRFQDQTFTLQEVVTDRATAPKELQKLIANDIQFIAVVADADTLLELSAIAGDDAVLLNIAAPDNRLRLSDCKANILHLAPSRAMLTDALLQYLTWKRWTKLSLISGSHPQDILLAQSMVHSVKKFGAKLVDKLIWAMQLTPAPTRYSILSHGALSCKYDRSYGYVHAPVTHAASISGDATPLTHRVASLLKRWWLGTHQGAISPEHLAYYLDEFTFRFNRRTSRSRGKLFYRLIEQALQINPVPAKTIIHNI